MRGSRQFCGVYVRACHPRHSTRSHECHHRVRLTSDPSCRPSNPPGAYILTTCRAILASFLLDEKLGRLGICGCASCIVSPDRIHIAAPSWKEAAKLTNSDRLRHHRPPRALRQGSRDGR